MTSGFDAGPALPEVLALARKVERRRGSTRYCTTVREARLAILGRSQWPTRGHTEQMPQDRCAETRLSRHAVDSAAVLRCNHLDAWPCAGLALQAASMRCSCRLFRQHAREIAWHINRQSEQRQRVTGKTGGREPEKGLSLVGGERGLVMSGHSAMLSGWAASARVISLFGEEFSRRAAAHRARP